MKATIGIDEVGRGCLAGPVVVAAALVRGNIGNAGLGTLKDSKKMSARQREAWFAYFRNNSHIAYAVARVYPRRIEALNISGAANLAAYRALRKLIKDQTLSQKKLYQTKIFLDGGLFVKNRSSQPKNARTVIKGDEKIRAVAVASIIAKVTRDHFMKRLAKRYPAYGFEVHKGYGTKMHQAAIRRYGPTDVHRLTFLA
jgi:ribonuclease HII